MTNIHWLGTGLSAIPGLKMLIENGHSVLVYNRTVEKAIKALSDVKGDYQVFVFSLQSLEENVAAGDIVCLLYTSPSPRDLSTSRMPSSA